MTANIAHLLICNKSVKALEDGGNYQRFIRSSTRMNASPISISGPSARTYPKNYGDVRAGRA